MKLGYSNLLGEHVEAAVIDYADCKNFQIVCPACREPVFKAIRPNEPQPLHYLSHYNKNRAYVAECELRVNTLSQQTIQRQATSSKEQRLKYFNSVLQKMLISHLQDCHRDIVKSRIKMALRQKTLRTERLYIFNTARKHVKTPDKFLKFFNNQLASTHEIERESVGETCFTNTVQERIASDIWACLLTPLGYGNFEYLWSYEYAFMMINEEETVSHYRESGFDSNDVAEEQECFENAKLLVELMDRLLQTSKEKGDVLVDHLRGVRLPGEEPSVWAEITAAILGSMAITLQNLPYLEWLKKALKEKAFQYQR